MITTIIHHPTETLRSTNEGVLEGLSMQDAANRAAVSASNTVGYQSASALREAKARAREVISEFVTGGDPKKLAQVLGPLVPV